MSNQPLPEDLLSGYLDNQLSPKLRAEVETELAINADLRAQFEILKRHSLQCASIPKFRLDNGFADQVLSDSRTEEAFSAMAGRHGVIRDDAINRSRIYPLRSAALAILALAALVLITLFLQNPEGAREAPVLSKSPEMKGTPGSKNGENEIAGNIRGDQSPDLTIEDRISPSTRSGADFDGQDWETDWLAKDGGGAIQVPESDNEAMKKELAAVDMVGTVDQQPVPSQMVDANDQKLEYYLQPSDGPKSEPESFGKGGVGLVNPKRSDELSRDQVVEVVPEPTGQTVSPSLGQITASESTVNNPAVSLDRFIEIQYSGGPEKLVDFATALSRNQIVINALPQGDTKQLEQLVPSVASNEKLGGLGNQPGMAGRGGIAGLGGMGGEKPLQTLESPERRQAGFQDLDDAIAPASHSQLFLITATPQQMVGLIGDLRNTAAISGYPMPELNSQFLPVQSGLEGSSLGVAKGVERQINLPGEEQEQSLSGLSRETRNAVREMGLESSQQEIDRTDVDALNLFFATQAGEVQEKNSQVRQYLLFVHSQNAAASDPQQPHSKISKPVPADALELKK